MPKIVLKPQYPLSSCDSNIWKTVFLSLQYWDKIYLPSGGIIRYFHYNEQFILSTVQGFTSEMELEKYIKYDYGSRKVLAAIIFYCNFKSSSDPLPLEVRMLYLEFSKYIVF